MEIDQYETQSYNSGHIFTFISRGLNDLVKIVRYERMNIIYNKNEHENFKSFNLGFGNKMDESFEIDDLARSNNGDMYIVFNTVLHSIPIFFSKFENATIHIKGSDKVRHTAYHRFINQRYRELFLEYELYGSLKGEVLIY